MSNKKQPIFSSKDGAPFIKLDLKHHRNPASGVEIVKLFEETDKSWLAAPMYRRLYSSGRIAKTFNPDMAMVQNPVTAMGCIQDHLEARIEAAKAELKHWTDQQANFLNPNAPYFQSGRDGYHPDAEAAELEKHRKEYIDIHHEGF